MHFESDYNGGAHPQILQALVATNSEITQGYGDDCHTLNAKRLLRLLCGDEGADVRLLSGGTQTNACVIDAILRPWEAVISADSAHINVHEAGAIEASGHHIYAVPNNAGKISAVQLSQFIENHYNDATWPHMPIPKVVYITQPTEFGTLYSLTELEDISKICALHDLKLYVDGARLVYALGSPKNDISLPQLYSLVDAFYLGGTKAGLLFGEALVAKPGLIPDFFTLMKQRGAVAAKGRIAGVQFETLLSNGLYLKIGKNAVDLALKLREAFEGAGYKTAIDSYTNQQFFSLPNSLIDSLQAHGVGFEIWGARGTSESLVRFVIGPTTSIDEINNLIDILHNR